MNKIVNLSTSRKSVPTRINYVQYATIPTIDFVLTDYTPGAKSTARIYIRKPSGLEVYNTCTIKDNIVTYAPTAQSFAESGMNICQLQIIDGNKVSVSYLIYATVEKNIIEDSAMESSNEYNALIEGYEEIEALKPVIANKADKSQLPTKTSQLTNDSGFITSANIAGVPKYGISTTNATTLAKVVKTYYEDFVLDAGASVQVLFQSGHTATGNVTMNVDGTGAKPVYRIGNNADLNGYWSAGEVVTFVYDGSAYRMTRGAAATTSSRGVTYLLDSMTSNIASGYALTPATMNKAMTNIITGALPYSASSTYAVGDYVRYGDYLYQCNTDITTAEAWTAAHWTTVSSLQTQIDTINVKDETQDTSITAIQAMLDGANFVKNSIDSGASGVFKFPTGAINGGLLLTSGASVHHNGIYFINVPADGTPRINAVKEAQYVTLTESNYAITVKNTYSAAALSFLYIVIRGSLTTKPKWQG